MMARYKLKFMFDWGSGVCLWSANENARSKFGDYPISCSELPVSQELKDELNRLIEWHDEALNWNDPVGPLLWDNKQVKEFLTEAKRLYSALCNEMSEEYEIEFHNQM